MKYWKVDVIESERGWGQKIDETHYFRSEEDAKKYVTEFNKGNTATAVPDWYMRAETPTTIFVPDELAAMIVEDFHN